MKKHASWLGDFVVCGGAAAGEAQPFPLLVRMSNLILDQLKDTRSAPLWLIKESISSACARLLEASLIYPRISLLR